MKKINQKQIHGAQKRIDYINRWALAFFAVFVVQAGWLATRFEAGEYGMMFWLGLGIAVASLSICGLFALMEDKRIERLEE